LFNINRKNLLSWLDPRIGLLLVFVLVVTAAKWRFWPWMPEVFFGDDLSNLLAYKDGHFGSSAGQALSAAYAEKYRPVFAWVMWLLFSAFEERILPYLALNVLLHGLSAALVFAIAHRLSRGNWIVALAIALAAATSRFALYQVTQVTGLLEGIALTLFLGMFYCVVRASEDKESAWRWSWLAVAAAFLTMHTHERYIVVAVWLCSSLILLPSTRMLPRARWLALLGTCVAVLVFNVLYKMAVLGVPIFVGTGGTRIDISTSRVLEHVVQAVLSIFGFNEGPEYLVGARSISLHWFPAWPLAAGFSLAWLTAVVMGVRTALSDKATASEPAWQPLLWPLLMLALGALLLGPPFLTIRLEQRWLLEPFILMLFLFAWAAGSQRHRALVPAWVLALVIGPASIAIDSIIAPYFAQTFFVSSGRFATAAKQDIVDKDFGQLASVGLVSGQDHCNWTLLKGHFFRLYGGTRRTVYCFGTVDESLAAELPTNTRIYGVSASPHGVSASPLHFTDVTSAWQASIQNRNEKASFDFLNAFSEGHINKTVKVSSPSGQGVMVIPWDTMLGRRNTLTVISGFSYRYDAVPIGRNAQLRFGMSMIYPSRESARAIVRINEERGGASRVLYSRDLTPPRAGEKLRFEFISVPLADFAGKNISVTFSVETPPGKDSSGHWVGFVAPRIVFDAGH
jgi:hypothetical protein